MVELFKEENKGEKKPSKIKSAAKFLFDIPAWIGANNIEEMSSWLGSLFKRVFLSRWGANVLQETFAQAVQRQQLTEENLQKQEKNFFRASLTFLTLGIFSLFYVAYLWHHADLLVVTAAVIVCVLLLLQAYFYSFWYFQVKVRRLGCSLKDWINWIVKGK